LICAQRGLITLSFLKCLKCSKVPKMPKVNEIFVSLEIDLAKGEHLNFSPACHSDLWVIRSV
jgi:hypothetical protein